MRVLVPGASSVLGAMICARLRAQGHEVTPAARRPCEGQVLLDLTREDEVRRLGRKHDAAVLTPILTVSAPAAGWLAEEGTRRIVCFSSNNVAVDEDSAVYEGLRQAERSLAGVGAATVILRPTMIYGYPGDGNLSRLLRFARRFGVLPMAGTGAALQQPVFVEDVAAAAAAACADGAPEGTFTVAGPDRVTTSALHAAVLEAAGRQARHVVPLPLGPLRAVSRTAARAGAPFPLSEAQLARMERDKTPVGAPWPHPEQKTGLGEGLSRLAAALAEESRRR